MFQIKHCTPCFCPYFFFTPLAYSFTILSVMQVTLKAMVLLNVSLSREVVPALARILLRASLGKKHFVRSLLRTDIVQVVNRRAWYNAAKLTAETLSLYKAGFTLPSLSKHLCTWKIPLFTIFCGNLCIVSIGLKLILKIFVV